MRKASGALHFYINGIDQGEEEEEEEEESYIYLRLMALVGESAQQVRVDSRF